MHPCILKMENTVPTQVPAPLLRQSPSAIKSSPSRNSVCLLSICASCPWGQVYFPHLPLPRPFKVFTPLDYFPLFSSECDCFFLPLHFSQTIWSVSSLKDLIILFLYHGALADYRRAPSLSCMGWHLWSASASRPLPLIPKYHEFLFVWFFVLQ